jgi:Protein of unknown function (DUF3047)
MRFFLSLFFAIAVAAHAEQVLFAPDFSRGLSNRWTNVSLYGARTVYSVASEGTNFFVHAAADDSCSALTMKLNLPATPVKKLTLRWRWRIAAVAMNGSDISLKTFDHAARVFVAFDTLIGPPRTLNYFWANQEPVGVLLDHPLTTRAKNFFIESGNEKAGGWIAEERDVTADWKRAFPNKPMPKKIAVGMLTDGDSLGIKISGDYADLQLIAE